VCVVCGEEASGWDMGLGEAEMVECEEGHIFCEKHMTEAFDNLSFEKKKQLILEANPDAQEDFESAEDEEDLEYIIDELFSEIEDELRYDIPKSQCPCCNLTSPTNFDILRYLAYEAGKTKEEAIEEMRSKFGTLQKMDEVLK